MPTRADIVEMAFRRLGLKAEDQEITADQFAYASGVLDALHAEVSETAPVPFWPDGVTDTAALGMASLLAAELGPSYMVPSEPRGRAMARLLAAIRSDTREDQNAEARYF